MFRQLITAVLGLAVFSALADTNNTNSQYNPTTGQTVPSVVILQSTDGITAKPIDQSNPLPVSGTITPSGTQNVNITQVGGNAVTTSVPVSSTAPTDAYPTGGTITTQDVASTTVQGQFNQNQTTGTPTANSMVSFAVAGYTTFTLGITGTWTGTVTLEAANAPAGVTGSTVWTNKTCRVPGSTLSTSTFTLNASDLICNVSGYTNARIRATAAITGTVTIGAVGESVNLHAIDLINPAKIVDGSGTSSTLTIKAASTAPLSADTAAVVTIGPNTAYTSPNATTNGASTITAGGTFQTVLASSATRKFWEFQNVCGKVGNCTAASDNCYLYLASSGSGTTANSIVVGPGSTYRESSGNIASDAVSATCDNTGDHYYLGSR